MLEAGRTFAQDEEWDPDPNDPFEIENRFIHGVNDTIDRIALEPTARAYVAVVPVPAQNCVSNFFSNLGEPINAVSHAMALNHESAGLSVSRFVMNTFMGGVGCFDVAKEAGVEEREADIGLAIRSWGDPDPENDQSVYLVLPLLGPSTPADGSGFYAGTFLNPMDYPYGDKEYGNETRSEFAKRNPYGIRDRGARNAATAANVVVIRAELLDATDLVREVALDEYSFIRDAYLEQRAANARELKQAD